MPFINYNPFDPSPYPDGAAHDPRAPYNYEGEHREPARQQAQRRPVRTVLDGPRRVALPPTAALEPPREERTLQENLDIIEASFGKPAPKRLGQ